MASIIKLATPGSSSFYLLVATTTVALVGTLGGLVGLHVQQTPSHGRHARQTLSYGRLGTAGFFVASAAATLTLVGVVLIFLARGGILGRVLLDPVLGLGLLGSRLGMALLGVGFLVLGVATLRERTLPCWCGVALVLAFPASMVLGDFPVPVVLGKYGGIVLGLVWLALGYLLLSDTEGIPVGRRSDAAVRRGWLEGGLVRRVGLGATLGLASVAVLVAGVAFLTWLSNGEEAYSVGEPSKQTSGMTSLDLPAPATEGL